jgi:hypothetical protein
MATRSPEEIRSSIERNRQELGTAVEHLRVEVVKLTDWRGQLRRHEPRVLIGAGVAGFVLGGGIAAVGGLLFGGRRRKARRAAVANAAIASAAGSIANVADSIAEAAGGAT